MKKNLILLLFIAFIGNLAAQKKHSKIHWLTDFKKAQKIAQKEHKPMLLLFTGSDWCPPCMAMHRDLFSNSEFKELSQKFVLVYVDFPRRKQISEEQREKNYALASKYHRGGVPTMVFVNPSGEIISKISGYIFGRPQRNLQAMQKVLENFK